MHYAVETVGTYRYYVVWQIGNSALYSALNALIFSIDHCHIYFACVCIGHHWAYFPRANVSPEEYGAALLVDELHDLRLATALEGVEMRQFVPHGYAVHQDFAKGVEMKKYRTKRR